MRFGNAIATAGSHALRITSTLARIPYHLVTKGAQAAASAVQALGRRLKNFITHAKGAKFQSNALVKTLTSLKRLLITRVKRMFISAIFNQVKEGMQALARYSDAFNGAMSRIKNSAKELSANLSVTLGGLVEKVEPAVTVFLDALSKLVVQINTIFAALQGKQSVTVAKEQMESYRDSLDDATESAKNLKAQVYGFDELNKRNEDNGEETDASDLFEEVPIDTVLPTKIKGLLEEIKALWTDGQYFTFGARISAGFGDVLTAVDDWIRNVFRPKAEEWAGRIAEVFNGLVAGLHWELMGKTLADGLNSVFGAINTFLTTFDFEALGKGIGKAINGWFDNVEWDLLGQTFANGWNALVDFIFGIVSEVDWANVGDSIAEFIQNFFDTIDWDKTAQTIITAINGIVEAFDHLFTGVDWNGIGQNIGKFLSDSLSGIDWGALFQTVIDGVNSIFELILGVLEGFDWGKVARSLAEGVNKIDIAEMLTNAARIVSEFATGVLEFVVHFIETVDWHELISKLWDGLVSIVNAIDFEKLVELAFELLGAAIGAATQIIFTLCEKIWELFKEGWEGIKSYFSEYIEAYGGNIIAGLFMGIVNALANIGQWIYDHIFKPFIDGFKKAFGINSPSTVMAETGKYIIDGLLQGLENTWKNITQFFDEKLSALKETLSNVWSSIRQSAEERWGKIKSTISVLFNSTQRDVTGKASLLGTALSDNWTAIKTTAQSAWSGIKTTVSGLFVGLKTDMQKEDWTSVGRNIATGVQAGVESAWSRVTSTVTTLASGLIKAAKDVFQISSPSAVFAAIGKFLDLGLAEGIDDYESSVLRSVSNMADDVVEQFGDNPATLQIGTESGGLVTSLSGVAAKLSDIAGIFREINASLLGSGGLQVPSIAAGTEVPYKTRVSSAASGTVMDASGDIDERLADQSYILRQILELLERAKLRTSGDEIADALAYALTRTQRGFGGA